MRSCHVSVAKRARGMNGSTFSGLAMMKFPIIRTGDNASATIAAVATAPTITAQRVYVTNRRGADRAVRGTKKKAGSFQGLCNGIPAGARNTSGRATGANALDATTARAPCQSATTDRVITAFHGRRHNQNATRAVEERA